MAVVPSSLLQVFRFHAETTPSPAFAKSLDSLLTVLNSPRDVLTSREPVTREMGDYFVRSVTYHLETAAGEEMGALKPADRVVVASAVHTAGLVLIRYRRSSSIGERVAELMRASADFCLFVKDRRIRGDAAAPAEQFLYDRLIAETTMSLKGLLDDSCLEPEQRSSLAEVLARTAIVSGGALWPDAGWAFPNLSGALWVHFGIDAAEARSAKLLYPASYLLSNTVWRREPLGDFEHLLAKCLEDRSLDAAKLAAARTVLVHARDPEKRALVDHFHQCLRVASDDPERRLKIVSDLSDIALESAGEEAVTLPGFLKTALEPRH